MGEGKRGLKEEGGVREGKEGIDRGGRGIVESASLELLNLYIDSELFQWMRGLRGTRELW